MNYSIELSSIIRHLFLNFVIAHVQRLDSKLFISLAKGFPKIAVKPKFFPLTLQYLRYSVKFAMFISKSSCSEKNKRFSFLKNFFCCTKLTIFCQTSAEVPVTCFSLILYYSSVSFFFLKKKNYHNQMKKRLLLLTLKLRFA